MNFPSRALLMLLSGLPLFLHAESLVAQREGRPSVRIGMIHDPEYSRGKSSAQGIEIGYATPVYPLENMVFVYGNISSRDIEHNYILLNFENSYPLFCGAVRLYGSSGVGYLLMDEHLGDDQESVLGRLALGLRTDLTSRLALLAEANYLKGRKGLWLEGDALRNHNVQYVISLGWKF